MSVPDRPVRTWKLEGTASDEWEVAAGPPPSRPRFECVTTAAVEDLVERLRWFDYDDAADHVERLLGEDE